MSIFTKVPKLAENWPINLKEIAWNVGYDGFEKPSLEFNQFPKDIRSIIIKLSLNNDPSNTEFLKLVNKEFYLTYLSSNSFEYILAKNRKYIEYGLHSNILLNSITMKNIKEYKDSYLSVETNIMLMSCFTKWCKANEFDIDSFILFRYLYCEENICDCDIKDQKVILPYINDFLLSYKSFFNTELSITYKLSNRIIMIYLVNSPDIKWIKALKYDFDVILDVCFYTDYGDQHLVKFIDKVAMILTENVEITPKLIASYLSKINLVREDEEFKQLIKLTYPFDLLFELIQVYDFSKSINQTGERMVKSIIEMIDMVNKEQLDMLFNRWEYIDIKVKKVIIKSNLFVENKDYILENIDKFDDSIAYMIYKKIIPFDFNMAMKGDIRNFAGYYSNKLYKYYKLVADNSTEEQLINIIKTAKNDGKILYLFLDRLKSYPSYKSLHSNIVLEHFKIVNEQNMDLKLLTLEFPEHAREIGRLFIGKCKYPSDFFRKYINFDIDQINPEILYLLYKHVYYMRSSFGEIATRLNLLPISMADNNTEFITEYFHAYKDDQNTLIEYLKLI